MTTSHSPLRVLKAQAKEIAANLKSQAYGESVVHDPAGKLAESHETGKFTFGVVMDDKTIKIEMDWATIRKMRERKIAEFILSEMKAVRL